MYVYLCVYMYTCVYAYMSYDCLIYNDNNKTLYQKCSNGEHFRYTLYQKYTKSVPENTFGTLCTKSVTEKCTRSVPKVYQKCTKSVPKSVNTFGTLLVHFVQKNTLKNTLKFRSTVNLE